MNFLLIVSTDLITLLPFSDLHSTTEYVSYIFMNGRCSYKLC